MPAGLLPPSALLRQAMEHHQRGELEQAEAACRRALASQATLADGWNILAAVLRGQRRLEEASAAAERATSLRPRVAPYWLNRGSLQADLGLERDAQASFRKAVQLQADLAEAHYALARSLHREGRHDDAIPAYRQATRHAPGVAEIRYHLADALMLAARPSEALQEYQGAFEADPGGKLDRRACFEHFNALQPDALPRYWQGEVLRFLARGDIDRSHYAAGAINILMADPEFRSACGEGTPDAEAVRVLSANALFGTLLRDSLLRSPALERALTRLRRRLLEEPAVVDAAPLAFLCGVAIQCFHNEFAWAEGAEEHAQVAQLGAGIGPHAPDESRCRAVAVYAMYRPLHSAAWVGALEASVPRGLEPLLAATVLTVREEQRLRESTPSLAPVEDEVSGRVRRQYEENPYPRWLSLQRHPALPAREWLAADMVGSPPAFSLPEKPSVLVAGCGTGRDALSLAGEIAGARVTAVDLSLASLAYAQRKASELEVRNVEFFQCDILELRRLGRRFDVVYCNGVLHHMRKPRAGLRVLLDLAEPHAALLLGLYSRPARAAVNEARRIVAERGLAPEPSQIRALRAEVLSAPGDSPLASLTRLNDFYALSDCRDLFFHVQEHQYDLGECAAFLEEEGLELLGLAQPVPGRALAEYRALYPEDRGMGELRRWQAVEERHPAAFIGMYQLWCRRRA